MATKVSETERHILCANWLRDTFPTILWLHIPNEGRRSWKEGKRQKAMGLMAGAADFYLSDGPRTLWVEIKADDGTQSPSQAMFERWVVSIGHEYMLAKSLREFQEIVTAWTDGRKNESANTQGSEGKSAHH